MTTTQLAPSEPARADWPDTTPQQLTVSVPAFVLAAFIQKWEEDTAASRRYGFKVFTFDEWTTERLKDVAFSYWRALEQSEAQP